MYQMTDVKLVFLAGKLVKVDVMVCAMLHNTESVAQKDANTARWL